MIAPARGAASRVRTRLGARIARDAASGPLSPARARRTVASLDVRP